MKKINILSIDGGGLRGYAPSYSLMKMEEDNKKFEVRNFFDVYAGTSTGVMLIVSILLDVPLEKIMKTYLDGKKNFFKRERASRVPRKLIFSQYKDEGINKAISENIDPELTLNDLYKKTKKTVMIYATDFTNSKPVIFATPDIKSEYVVGGDFLLKDIIRSAIAAPGYFELNEMKINGKKKLIGDGGMWSNNPSGMTSMIIKSNFKNSVVNCLSFGNEVQDETLFTKDYSMINIKKVVQDIIKISTRSSMSGSDFVAKNFSKNYLRVTMKVSFNNPLHKLSDEFIEATRKNYTIYKEEISNFINNTFK